MDGIGASWGLGLDVLLRLDRVFVQFEGGFEPLEARSSTLGGLGVSMVVLGDSEMPPAP